MSVNQHDRLVESEVIVFNDVFDAVDMIRQFMDLRCPVEIHTKTRYSISLDELLIGVRELVTY